MYCWDQKLKCLQVQWGSCTLLSGSELPAVCAFGRDNQKYLFYYEVDNGDHLDGKWQLKFVSVLETGKERHGEAGCGAV